MAEDLVQIRGLTKTFYGRAVLADVTFSIRPGEVFGYIGPNGAGKTTTLKILAGLIGGYQGQVLIGGADVATERARAHALLGYMPQAAGFQQWRTVDSALDTLGALSGVPADIRRKRIPELLERFDLLDARRKKVKELSGGMTQKLALVQALLHDPKLLVLDEPLEGLDPPSRSLLKTIIRERQRAGVTVLFSSHILSDVQDVADRVGILHNGQIATKGAIRDLLSTFGLPVEIELELAVAPPDLAFVHAAGPARELKPNQWRIEVLAPDADTDAIVHTLVEKTLAGGGRIRKVGVAEPELDELFAQYLRRAAGGQRAN
ncbi:MAG: ABC transporter ATP-binding protein [Deltaproteobacteria bacterium]|nr:ABC transporter ATP-binding protein [Deltaproteobacteria bacterium]